jgi:hypothetical protein
MADFGHWPDMSAAHAIQFDVVQFAGQTTDNTTEGASTEVVPVGAKSLFMEMWGPGGGGARNTTTPGGGGGGAYCAKTIAIAAVDWLKTISYVVGTHGLGGVTAATVGAAGSNTTMTAITLNGVSVQLQANSGGGGPLSSPGTGGAASGGDSNLTGGNGTASKGGDSANGGAGGTSGNLGNPPGGGGGGTAGGAGRDGARGEVKFTWT